VVVIVWYLDLPLRVQSVLITTLKNADLDFYERCLDFEQHKNALFYIIPSVPVFVRWKKSLKIPKG
jgi:hypothetical protein